MRFAKTRKMYKYIRLGLLCLFFALGCSEKGKDLDNSEVDSTKINKNSSKLFRLNEPEKPGSLFPLAITDVVASRIASQVYEGLFKLDPRTLEPVPCLATDWKYSEDRHSIVINLKKGVLFHKDTCFGQNESREFTADDVVYCFTNLAAPMKLNLSNHVIENTLEGTKEYYLAQKEGKYEIPFKGIEKVSKYSIRFNLQSNSKNLFYLLSRPETFIYPKKALDYYGFNLSKKMVGTGPFIQSNWSEKSLLLLKNPEYHGQNEKGNKLPPSFGVGNLLHPG